MDSSKREPPHAMTGMTTVFQLNLRHLRGLLAVQKHGSISAAAAAVNLSQPALTQGILKLENQLGEVLLERRSDGIVPTSAGELVLQRAQASLRHLAAGGRLLAGAGFDADRRLTMTQVRAFLSLFRTGSFATAAIELALSQAAVHRAVRELEEALGRKLVERRGRGVHVNFGGQRFARSCRLAIQELQAAMSELGLDPQNPTVAIGTTPMARAFLVPEAMSRMVAEKFPVRFRVLEGSWGELVESLRDGLVDFIVGELPAENVPDLVTTALHAEAPIIVAGRQHALNGQPSPSRETLAACSWIIAPDTSPLRAQWERLFPDKWRPEAPVECESVMITSRLLTGSDMLTLAMRDQVALQIRSGLLTQIGEPLSENMSTVGVTMRQGWRPARAQERFLQLLRAASASLVADAGHASATEAAWRI